MSTAWIVNDSGEVWTVQPQGGGQLIAPAGTAQQVTLGFDGIPWVLTPNRGSGAGNLVQYYYQNTWETLPPTIGAIQISGSTNNFCWLVDENFAIWAVNINGTALRQSPDGFALRVGVGNFGPPWAITTQPNETIGGNLIAWYNENNGQWVNLPATASGAQIAGQYDNSAWVVTGDNSIVNYQQNGTGVVISPPNTALQVAIGPDKMPWAISTQPGGPGGSPILYYANGAWNTVPAPATAVWVGGSM